MSGIEPLTKMKRKKRERKRKRKGEERKRRVEKGVKNTASVAPVLVHSNLERLIILKILLSYR